MGGFQMGREKETDLISYIINQYIMIITSITARCNILSFIHCSCCYRQYVPLYVCMSTISITYTRSDIVINVYIVYCIHLINHRLFMCIESIIVLIISLLSRSHFYANPFRMKTGLCLCCNVLRTIIMFLNKIYTKRD